MAHPKLWWVGEPASHTSALLHGHLTGTEQRIENVTQSSVWVLLSYTQRPWLWYVGWTAVESDSWRHKQL